ncbi:MAG: cysteine--tRNA ligase [Candidatus Omnitrophota bacterium]|jgi:cysteinyl-tRNA synthetase
MNNTINIYNSLTRKKDIFKPLKDNEVKMYVCGPTVYDEPHIGHARSAYIFDVIRRYLTYKNNKVTFVRNVTDVDDKIIDKARNEFKGEDLNSAVRKVSQKYLDSYHEAMASLGILPPDFEPKATEYIAEMQIFIQGLIERGVAYESLGDVYFDIKKAKDYGKLSNQSLDKMEAGVRITQGEKKKDPLDFALWKSTKEGEPSWESPWGRGRPGWHIECSVMSSKLLGDEFDIHGGGIDLIFPHHENEIAQSEGAAKKFARYWIHHGLLTINGQKMSKSSGNFITIRDFMLKYKNADLLKLFFLSAHYSHPIDYTDKKIEEAKVALERIIICLDKIKIDPCYNSHEHKKNEMVEHIRNKFTEVMDDDFNTPQALACLFELVTLLNKNINDGGLICQAGMAIKDMLLLLGVSPEIKQRVEAFSDMRISELISERNKARLEKDFTLSDKIRKELEEEGIILEDTKDGKSTWRRKL